MGEAGTGPDRRAEKAHLSSAGGAGPAVLPCKPKNPLRSAKTPEPRPRFRARSPGLAAAPAVRQNARAPDPDSALRRRGAVLPRRSRTARKHLACYRCQHSSLRHLRVWASISLPPPPPPLPTTNASIRVSATSNGASRAVNSYSKPNLRPGRHLTPEGRLNHLITYCGGRVGWHRWNGIGGVIVHPTAVAQGASSPTSPRRSESRWFRRVVSLSPRHTATQKR